MLWPRRVEDPELFIGEPKSTISGWTLLVVCALIGAGAMMMNTQLMKWGLIVLIVIAVVSLIKRISLILLKIFRIGKS